MEIYLTAKIFLVLFLWFLIGLSILFIVKSRSIYKSLKKIEHSCNEKRREVIHRYVPLMATLSNSSKTIQGLLRPKKESLQNIIVYAADLLYIFSAYKTFNLGFNVFKKFLRRQI